MREASAGGGFQRILLGHSAHSPLKSLRNFQYAQAAIGHVHQVDAGHHPEQLAGYMASTPNAGGSHVDLAGIGLGESNEFRNGLDGCTTMRLGSYIALQRQVRDKANRATGFPRTLGPRRVSPPSHWSDQGAPRSALPIAGDRLACKVRKC